MGFTGQSSEGEHADLVGDVVPVSRGSDRVELILEGHSHVDDSLGNHLDFSGPLLVQGGSVQDFLHETSSVKRRAGVVLTDVESA